MSLEQLIAWWSESLAATASPRTRKLYVEAAVRLLGWLRASGLPEAPPTRAVLNRYFSGFRTEVSQRTGRPLSPGYVNQHWRSLQQFYKFLESEELIKSSPFGKMTQPTIPDSPVPIFTTDDLTALFKATAGTDTVARRDRAIIRVLLDCGIRVGELANLKVSDLSFPTKTLRVTGKGSHSRDVPFNAKAYTELRRWLLVKPAGELLFVGLHGRHAGHPLSEGGIRQMLNRRASTAGVSNPHPHRWRHTAAHLWLANGGSETDLRRIMGWRSPAMVYRYAASAGAERARSASHRMALADRF